MLWGKKIGKSCNIHVHYFIGNVKLNNNHLSLSNPALKQTNDIAVPRGSHQKAKHFVKLVTTII